MTFRGWQKISFNEWPGKICSIVFIPGCNFRCPFCYNRDLVLNPEKLEVIRDKEILNYVKKHKDFLDGIMITGGEPLKVPDSNIKDKKQNIKNELIEFIKEVKKIGLKVGIETNGLNSEAIGYLIKNKLVDYLAMDIKAPLKAEKYQQLAGVVVDLKKIKKSIKIIKKAQIESEFRTTVVPGLLKEKDILEIAKELKGAKKYYLQNFQPKVTLVEIKEKPYSQKWFQQLERKIKKIVNTELRI